MGLRLPFEVSQVGKLTRGLFVSREQRPVQVNSPVVLDADWEDDLHTPCPEFAVNNNNREEVAVYLGLAWRLLRGRRVFAIGTGYSLDAERRLRRVGGVVRWEYSVNPAGQPGEVEERGFVKAHSSAQIMPRPTAYQQHMHDRAELFELHSFVELVSVARAVLGDAYGELNLFGVSGDPDVLFRSLAGESRPAMTSILAANDIFVDVILGVDLGYNDALLVYTYAPIEDALTPALSARESAITTYERAAPFVSTLEGLLAALQELAHPIADQDAA